MKFEGERILLRIWLRSTDRHGLRTAAEALIERARNDGLAGATLLRGIAGLDVAGELLQRATWSPVERVPAIVEIVDSAQRIASFLLNSRNMVAEGIATLERAHVLLYRRRAEQAADAKRRLQVPPPIVDLSTLPTNEELAMAQLAEDGQLLRVFIGEADTWQGEPLYLAIVNKAKELGLAGATVLHGTMGFGAGSRIHTSRLLERSTNLPIVVEIVDTAERVENLLSFLDEAVQEGMITIESVRVLKYRAP